MATRRIPPGCVVVGVHQVRASDRAVDWGADQAALESRHLHLVHGTGDPPAPDPSETGVRDPATLQGELEATGHSLLAGATTRALSRHPDLVVHRTLSDAEPGRLLVDLSHDASLVVVGSRARGHLLRLMTGSVSEDVANRSFCPVVVLRPRHEESAHTGVLAALDGSPESLAALRFALHHAAVRRQAVTLLLTRWDAGAAAAPPRVLPADEPGLTAEREILVDALAGAAEPGEEVPTRLLVGLGTPSECVLLLAGDMDLVVVGHDLRPGPERAQHGSVAIDVLENAPSTVAVVPLSALRPDSATP